MLPSSAVVVLSAALLLTVARAEAQEPGQGPPYDPISAYKPRTIQGFSLLVSNRLLEHPSEASAVLRELGAQLERVVKVVPARPLARLREVRIWVERANRPDKAAEFHPSADWLSTHGYQGRERTGTVRLGVRRVRRRLARLAGNLSAPITPGFRPRAPTTAPAPLTCSGRDIPPSRDKPGPIPGHA